MTDLREILAKSRFGGRTAEEEQTELSAFFVETPYWRSVFEGEVDVVYGSKGSGKTAIYTLLLNRSLELRQRGILVIAAENPRGAPAFGVLAQNPPKTEFDFINLWTLYFLILLAHRLQTDLPAEAKELVKPLHARRLLEDGADQLRVLRRCIDWVRSLRVIPTTTITFDPRIGVPVATIGLDPRVDKEEATTAVGTDWLYEILESADEFLRQRGLSAWILIDRLDIAFEDSEELESNALRGLFKAYRELTRRVSRISLKIFLRDDIWSRITQKEMFRGATHIERETTITWPDELLSHLVARRLLSNVGIQEFAKADPKRAGEDLEYRADVLYRIFPLVVEEGGSATDTLPWMLSRTRDGTGRNTPRELIHLLIAAAKQQIALIDLGAGRPLHGTLFHPTALIRAMAEVSRARLERTIYSEHPTLGALIRELDQETALLTTEDLARIWRMNEEGAHVQASQLVEIGVFAKVRVNEKPCYWVPYLYQSGLGMISVPPPHSTQE